nr:MAG TPA: hypothetical protein [Caudoviricetes sp.]
MGCSKQINYEFMTKVCALRKYHKVVTPKKTERIVILWERGYYGSI